MAKLTEREVVILVKALGLDKAIAGFGTLDKSIKQTQKTSGELDRNMKGTANITSNTTKAFAKQAQGLGGLVHVYATVAANVFALSSAFNVLKSNADLKIMEQASRQLSVASGTNFNLVAKSLKEVTGGAISMKEAMQTATLGLRGGATSVQLQQITEVATKAAKALGRSVPEAVTRLTQAVIKGEPELADEFGIILRVEEATKKYAATLGKTVSAMTTFERQQAIINQAIEQGQKKYGELKLDTNPYDQLAATFTELTQKILNFVSLPLGQFFKLFADNTALLTLAILAFAKAVVQRALPEVFKLGAAMIENAKKASSEAIISYNAQADALDNLAKKQQQYASIARTKKINVLGVLGDTGLKAAIPKLSKEIDAAKGDVGKIARSLFQTFYSQIHKEAKKFGGDISKVVATNIRAPLQREFLLMGQEVAALKIQAPDKILNQTISGIKLTVQEYKYLNQVIDLYRQGLQKGITQTEAMKIANDKLAMSTAGVRAAFGKVIIEGRNLYSGLTTLKLGLTQGSQLMQQGALQGKNLKESVALVRKELETAGVGLDRVNPKILSLGVSLGKGIGAVSNFISGLGAFVGGLFNLVMVVTLVWEGLKVLGEWLGATNSKMTQAASNLGNLEKEFVTTRASIAKFNEDLKTSKNRILDVDAQLELLGRRAAIFDTLAMHAKAFGKELQSIANAGNEGWIDTILSKMLGKDTDIATMMKRQLAILKGSFKEAGKEFVLPENMFYKLITPESFVTFKNGVADLLKSSVSPDNLAGAIKTFQDSMYAVFDPSSNIELVTRVESGALRLSEGFTTALATYMKSQPIFKDFTDEQFNKLFSAMESKLPELESKLKSLGFKNIEDSLLQISSGSREGALAMQVFVKTMEDFGSKTSSELKASESALNAFISNAKTASKDLEKAQDDLLKGTADGYEKYYQVVLKSVADLNKELLSVKDMPDINPYDALLSKAPELVKLLNITEESFNTQQVAQETLSRLAAEASENIIRQAELQKDIILAEQALETAKRNVGLVDSKNFEEKKKALNTQYDAEEKLIDLQILQLEQRKAAIEAQRESISATYSQAVAEAELLFILGKIQEAQLNIALNTAAASASVANAQLEGTLSKLQGEIDAAKAQRDALKPQRMAALGKVDSAASSSGESAADKAQAQAEKMANLEASIAKKRLERASMFLALEKELGDAVESRMEWELTGAREAVALGNKRIAILGREVSMQAALVPMKKSVMEAEARALEVKAEGLEKDGELKAAEEARLEVANKRQEMNNLDIEYITMRLEYEQKLYDVALKQHDLRKRAMIPTFKEGSGIQGSEEFFQSAKVEFALRWDKFMDEMTSPVDRLLDAFEGAIDSGVDAFVEAIANGEDALAAAGEAIKKTIFELAKEWLKEDIKNFMYATVGKALGMEDPKEALKEELLKLSAQDKSQHTEITGRMDSHYNVLSSSNQYLSQIAAKIGMQGAQSGFGNIAGQMGNMFGMNQQQFTNVSAGLEGLFDQRPDIFGSNAGLSGQIDSMFAAQPDIFGAAPGYASAFNTSPSFGLDSLGSSFMNVFGTTPTMPTQSIGSSDIFGGSNPLSMSTGSMMNMTGIGSIFGPNSALTQGISSVGQSLSGNMQPMQSGMGMSPVTQTPQMSFGGVGGMMGGLGITSMMTSMLPMLMGVGGGSPAGQAAKEKSSSDSALGQSSGGSSDKLEDLKDETEELKDISDKLLTEIKDHVLDIKLNQIAFQIEHMEKIDKNFITWLATYMLTHMQNIMLFTMMIGQLQMLVSLATVQISLLSQIAQCTCSGAMGMKKGGIVSGLIRGYAKGAITSGPELAMIGEGTKREAIVPLPDNRSIPVTFTNTNDDNANNKENDNRPINIVINGVEGTEKGLRRSAAQIAYEVHRTSRNKVSRY